MITKELIDTAFRINSTPELAEHLQATCDAYGISSKEEICAFLAQTAHESGGYNLASENLNYSADGLLKTFPKYFSKESAKLYARKPADIANRVYANRMGNGAESSGDGSTYRGAGFMQLTGKSTIEQYATDKQMSVEDAAEYARTLEGACDSAGWYWWKHSLNQYADDFELLSRKINGGTNGLDDRLDKFHSILSVFPD
jgi:putative chitinase